MTSFQFDSKTIVIPGAYSTIKGGIKNPILATAFGNTFIVSTGYADKFFGIGAGINGTLKSGKDSIYTFVNSRDFKKAIKGGMWWLLAGPLFSPGGGATAGISSLSFVKAATTVPAEIDIAFGESTSDGDANDGFVTIQVNDEGYQGNGVLGDETRAKATITVTNAGTNGNEIGVTISGEPIGTYIVQTGDTVATVVAGLATAINAYGLAEVFSQSATQIVIYAPRGKANAINGVSPVITVTGSAAGNSGAFAGGVEGTILTRGYAAKMFAGTSDTSKYIVKFYRGTFKGIDSIISNGDPYDSIAELSAKAEIIAQSPEISTVQELVTYMQSNFNFKSYFTLSAYTIAASDAITIGDLAAYSTYVKASGGTESYSADDLSAVIDAIDDLFIDFIITDNWGDNSRSLDNLALLNWITTEAQIKPDFYVAGGRDINKWNGSSTSSNELAVAFDSEQVSLVHGGAKKTAIGGQGFKEYDSIYKAADLLGREAGLPPQVPLTFKNIGIEGELHPLNKKDVTLGLQNGVLMSWAQAGAFEVPKGVNTLQNSAYLINPDGSTASKQLSRIKRQLNKELIINIKASLLKKPDGANRNTVSAEDVKTFVQNYLQSRCATKLVDNLLITWNSVDVIRNQDAYEVVYQAEANTEISFVFTTGFIVDNN